MHYLLLINCAKVKFIAIQFLLRTGFNLESPFQEGVRYLSTKEEEKALQEASKQYNRPQTASIAQLELLKEPEVVAFLATVRRDIDKWLDSGQVRLLDRVRTKLLVIYISDRNRAI